MSLLTTLMQKRSTEQQLSLKDPALRQIFSGGIQTVSGQNINPFTAMNISAVYACIKVIAETIASLPFITYRRLDGGKERATAHPLFRILKDRPNTMMTSAEFRMMMQSCLLLWGNAFAQIEYDGGGRIVNLWPWRPDRIRILVTPARLWYFYNMPDGPVLQFPQEDVLHLRGLASDGIMGYSPVTLQRESMGLCNAAQEYRARFFLNDARPGGTLQHPGKLGPEALKNLRESINDRTTGDNRRGYLILEEGMTWHDVGIPPNDAQFIEGWQVQKEDIAGIYRVPPYKIGIMKPGTVSHSSVEQANLDFWTDCIRCWAVCWEQRVNLSLFMESEQRTYFAEFLADAILRADTLTRYQAYQLARQNGWMNADEIREKENLNSIPDGDGKEYWRPANMAVVGEEPPAPGFGLPNGKAEPMELNGRGH